MYAVARTKRPRMRSSATPRYRRSKRSISTPPRNGTSSPGNVTTMTCRLTLTVECVADMMYQLTPTKFMPLPNSDTNMATKKQRKPRCAQMRRQSTGCATAVAMELSSLLSCAGGFGDGWVRGLHRGDGRRRCHGKRTEMHSAVRPTKVGREGTPRDERDSVSWKVQIENSVCRHEIGEGRGRRATHRVH